MGRILGVDFGSLFCRTAVAVPGGAEVFPNRYAERALPRAGGGPSAGSLKEALGSEDSVVLEGRAISASDAVAQVFRRLVEDARERLGTDVAGAVVGVPGHFRERQRAALHEAVERGGLPKARLLEEPVAALMASGPWSHEQTGLVYALGAFGFCASAVRLSRDGLRALCHEGVAGLGGVIFTEALAAVIRERLGVPAGDGILVLAERAKLDLSRKPTVRFDISSQMLSEGQAWAGGPRPPALELTREEFEACIRDGLDETMRLSGKAAQEAGTRVDVIFLLGGSTAIPLVERRLREAFPDARVARLPDSSVACGLAVYGERLGEQAWRKQPEPEAPRKTPAAAAQPAERPTEPGWPEVLAPALSEAQRLWYDGRPDAAIARIEAMMQEDAPKFVGHLCHRYGKELLAGGHYDASIAALRRALQHNARDQAARADYHRALGKKAFHLAQVGSLAEAASTIAEALRADPRCLDCRQLAGKIDSEIRRMRSAESHASRKKRRR